MHEDEHTKFILEKRYSRKITGCMLFVLPVAWLVTGLVGPPAYLVGAVFYGLLFLALLGKYIFKDLSDSENIVITPVGVHLGEGFGSIKIDWCDLGELYTNTHTSSHSSSSGHGEVVVETDVIYLKTKGSDQEEHTHTIDFSQWGGRFVKDHMAFYTAARVIEMFKKTTGYHLSERAIGINQKRQGNEYRRIQRELASSLLESPVFDLLRLWIGTAV